MIRFQKGQLIEWSWIFIDMNDVNVCELIQMHSVKSQKKTIQLLKNEAEFYSIMRPNHHKIALLINCWLISQCFSLIWLVCISSVSDNWEKIDRIQILVNVDSVIVQNLCMK